MYDAGSGLTSGWVSDMEIMHMPVDALTRGEYLACSRANFGDEGLMQPMLKVCRQGDVEGKTITLWTPTKRRTLLAWALLTPVSTTGIAPASSWAMKQSKYTVMFWVKWQHRGKGYGKVLMNEVHEYDERPHVLPHDEVSEKFFSGHRVMIMKVDKNWRDTA